ncbi:MAG: hypothetical protein ACI376_02470 [Candidatus Bruticola sp.]
MLESGQELLRRQRRMVEYLTWKAVESNPSLFRYVQEPIYSLSVTEEYLIEFMHKHGLEFELQPRYNSSSPVVLNVTINQCSQKVKLNCISGLSCYCSFMTARTPFASDFKGWLDRAIGSERFDRIQYTGTRRWVSYPYVLPLYDTVNLSESGMPELSKDSRHVSYLFNFNSKEQEFLRVLEEVVSDSDDYDNPLFVRVYPRISYAGSIELVISNFEGRQSVRIFSSGSHPVIYQIITENTELVIPLKTYLDNALGLENLDRANCRLTGKMISLIYTHRSPSSIEEIFDDGE